MTAFAFSWLSFFLLICYALAETNTTCPEAYCGLMRPMIRYPFWLRDHQDDNCGSPGFDLSCDIDASTTLVNFPFSGDFVVERINYDQQTAWIKDRYGCLPRRLRTFNITNSKLKAKYFRSFTFYYCLKDLSKLLPDSRRVPCLSDQNYTVVAVPSGTSNENILSWGGCREDLSWEAKVPHHDLESSEDITERMALAWDEPSSSFGGCDDTTFSKPGCPTKKKALPLAARIGICIGFVSPWFSCIIAIAFYINRKSRSTTNSSASRPEQLQVAMEGVDIATIESNYPKIQIDESFQLPRRSDNTCSICLCEYKTTEIIRTILECNHYFHADCLEHWLKKNATCPLCRNLLV